MSTALPFGGNLVKFPETMENIEKLKDWLFEQQTSLPTTTQIVNYDHETSFVGVMFDTASGTRAISAYIYVCSPRLCRLFAMRATNASSLNLTLSSNKQELVLKSDKGLVYLIIPLQK
jgi:hypothetical protein